MMGRSRSTRSSSNSGCSFQHWFRVGVCIQSSTSSSSCTAHPTEHLGTCWPPRKGIASRVRVSIGHPNSTSDVSVSPPRGRFRIGWAGTSGSATRRSTPADKGSTGRRRPDRLRTGRIPPSRCCDARGSSSFRCCPSARSCCGASRVGCPLPVRRPRLRRRVRLERFF